MVSMAREEVIGYIYVILILLVFGVVTGDEYTPSPNIGYPAGLVPNCPGVLKNATISPKKLQMLRILVHKVINGKVHRSDYPITGAAKSLAKDKLVDFKNKKTVFYIGGFVDSAYFPFSQAMGTVYSRRGYNVLLSETFQFLTYIYPKSVRLSKVIGDKIGELLVNLENLGLKADNLEIVGMSIGAHIAGYAAKYYFNATGRKPSRLTGLDPAGPCFRGLPPDLRLRKTDAERVDILHTNIDGFGIAENLGHVDYYVNGGEYQPSDIVAIPCLVICSHVRSAIYWWLAVQNPKKFIAIKCDSIQDARFAKCYNGTEINYVGLETKFDRPGLYYLPTYNEFPYYRAKEGLNEQNEIYKYHAARVNAEDMFVV
ncbi:PREDICTED: lipase member H-B-like isoform X1 [Papilio polytes]|uniref:lipase member H-B-like isoform X1 n=2 Tax=Papilio polytes TaxID=76194 RepID=UPI000675ED55|nr:PREDICTED: lipase member H-B-like isoform X1 [Papilio polytes]